MSNAVKDRGPGGQGSIVFRQKLDYPKAPGNITYYPPEPSDELKKQMRNDRAGGLALYIMGFAVVLLGFLGAMSFSDAIQIYAFLIPFLLILGLVFAVLFLRMNNLIFAKLSRTMPTILVMCLALMYIFTIFASIMGLAELGDGASESAVSGAFETLFLSLLNPAFFLMSAGLMICLGGGNMLCSSTKAVNEYIPGMIIIEVPESGDAAPQKSTDVQAAVPTSTCIQCGGTLEYIPQYGRHYCYGCKSYAPKKA